MSTKVMINCKCVKGESSIIFFSGEQLRELWINIMRDGNQRKIILGKILLKLPKVLAIPCGLYDVTVFCVMRLFYFLMGCGTCGFGLGHGPCQCLWDVFGTSSRE
jgi:hypothetical protein